MSYNIIRFYHPSVDKHSKVMKRGLTLEQAQAHCNNPKTRKDDHHFDGYTKA